MIIFTEYFESNNYDINVFPDLPKKSCTIRYLIYILLENFSLSTKTSKPKKKGTDLFLMYNSQK